MRNLFSPDAKWISALSIVADYIFFNLIFLFTCIPVFTVGAAKTALYRVMFGMNRGDGSLYKRYFKTFVREIPIAALMGLIKYAIFAALAYLVMLVYINPGIPLRNVELIALLILVLVWSVVFSSLFVQIALFRATVKQYLSNCAYIALTQPIISLVVGVMDLIPIAVLLYDAGFMGATAPVWILFYFSVTTNLAARMWRRPFEEYIEKAAAENDAPEA